MKKKFQILRHQLMFFNSFIGELGGIHKFIFLSVNTLITKGFEIAKAKAQYILHQSIVAFQPINNAALSEKDLYKKYISIIPNLQSLKSKKETFKLTPLISIVMPTYNSNRKWLKEAIKSVNNQVYTNWELCIADDASDNEECKSLLRKYQLEDKRIKVVFRNKNGHISNASNSALEIVSGEYVALLDHDDKLPPDALFWIVKTINDNPNAKLIYSDEDKFDEEGNRMDPYFKCDWNYQLFLSQNLVNHLGVYNTKIIKKIGGFREGFEGSQDYDLILRFIEQISPKQIIHIPRILYHWRIHKNSTAYRSDEKPYALLSAQRAIGEHLDRINISATVELLKSSMYRVKYILPQSAPFVSIIIPSKNNFHMLKRCINSIETKTDYNNYEIIIVDNNSHDTKTMKFLNSIRKKDKIRVLSDKRKFNFSAINNSAVKSAKGDYICFLNDDTEVITPEWLTEMLSQGIQKGVGAVGARLWYPNKTLQHGGVIMGIGGVAGHAHKYLSENTPGYFNRANLIQEFSAITGACMLVSKKVFNEVDGFDEKNLSVAFNDVDLCLKIRELDYRIVWTPYAELYHHESISRGEDKLTDSDQRFKKENEFMLEKWKKWINNDPAYSPNLTLEREDFSFAWPPRIQKLD